MQRRSGGRIGMQGKVSPCRWLRGTGVLTAGCCAVCRRRERAREMGERCAEAQVPERDARAR